MSKITLNFFGEIVSVEKPKNLASLRNDIARLFFFSPQDAAEILLTYNDNGDKLIISNDEDLKAFLETDNSMIDLDICQNSKIYKENLNQLQEETLKDKSALEELLKKRDELNKLKETKFAPEREEMKKIQAKMELFKEKTQIRKKIFEGVRQIEKEKKENEKKIVELQKKLGIKVEKPVHKKPEIKATLKKMKPFYPFNKLVPPFMANNMNNFQKNFPHHHHHHHHHRKPFGVKFGKTEYINIPKDQNRTMAGQNEKSNDFDLKMRTIDDWGKCLLNKTQEITNRLAETFKGFPTLTLSLSNEEDKKEKNEKLVHPNIICDGCEKRPLVGKRYKCKVCKDFDFCEECYEKNKAIHKHEFTLINKAEFPKFHHKFPKVNPFFRHSFKKHMEMNPFKPEMKPNAEKLQHCKTMGNIFEKDKISNKVMHFGVKCDGCGAYPIVGCRFKCAVCDDFDYCETCENKLSEKHNHPFLKIYEPKMNPIFFKCVPKK